MVVYAKKLNVIKEQFLQNMVPSVCKSHLSARDMTNSLEPVLHVKIVTEK